MQQSLSLTSTLALVLVCCACHGKLAVLDDPPIQVDSGSSSSSGTGAGASLTALDLVTNCSDLQLAPSGVNTDSSLPLPIECGACDCNYGQSTCEEQACVAPSTLPRCKESTYDTPDNAVVWDFSIESYVLTVELQGYGGCGKQDFALCYIPPDASPYASQTSYPRRATIKQENLTTPEQCDRMAFQKIQMDLRTLGEFKSAQGGLVESFFGDVAVGPLTCLDQRLLADDHFGRFYDFDRSCETDSDCEVAFLGPSCGRSCTRQVASHAGVEQLRAHAAEVDADVCARGIENCDPSSYPVSSTAPLFELDPSSCPDGPAPRCVRGQCH